MHMSLSSYSRQQYALSFNLKCIISAIFKDLEAIGLNSIGLHTSPYHSLTIGHLTSEKVVY